MYTVLRIDVEAHTQVLRVVLNVLVHAGRTEAVFDALEFRIFDFAVLVPVSHLQMARLVLLMIRASPAHTCEDIERNLAIWLRILDLLGTGPQALWLRDPIDRA